MDFRLSGIKEIKGKIILKTGLHIGAGDMEMRIGGLDNPVIKHPHTLEPYIPGSSLKGKVRSLLEMRSGLMGETDGKPLSLETYLKLDDDKEKQATCGRILKLFGAGGNEEQWEKAGKEIGATRVSFADCHLDKRWRDTALKTNLVLTEVKSENTIDRIKGTAQHPRSMERVPAYTEFSFSVTLKQMGDEPELLDLLLEGLRLMEKDALGGSGSRGYGRIEFDFAEAEEEIKQKWDKLKGAELLQQGETVQ